MPDVWMPASNGKAVGLEDLEMVAQELITKADHVRVLLFFGSMGAGKTTLIKSIVKSLGSLDVVQSPSFSIINEYTYGLNEIFHFDFYRISKEEEAYDMGVEEYFDSGNYCLVEWPERIPTLLPQPRLEVRIDENTIDKRTIYYRMI